MNSWAQVGPADACLDCRAAIAHEGTWNSGVSAALRQLALPQMAACAPAGSGADWFRRRIRDVRAHPGFATAAADYARNTVQLFEGRYLVNKALANVARQTVCIAILSTYFGQSEKEGAFLSSIQALTTRLGVCSKNTTAAIVALLERLGLVLRVENPRDRRWLFIQPTANLVSAISDSHRLALAAADSLFPSDSYGALFDRDQVVRERCFAVGLYFYIAIHSSVFSSPRSRAFTDSEGGTTLLLKLMSLREPGWRTGDQIIDFPYDEIGALFGLSRTHVRRLMRRAEAAGFVRLLQKGGRQVRILPALEDLFENLVAANIARAQFDMALAGRDGPI
jgi:DNA-binding MarR family transcriptional regulator